jgi:riboflavin kinase/FMN adenylyltransferase
MRVYRSLEEARGKFGPSVLTIGNFDGVHVGHQQLFREVVRRAEASGWSPSVLTFHPHPTQVVAPERAPKLLSTLDQRCLLMEECGIAQVMILPFDSQIAKLSPEEFVSTILVESLDTRCVLVGENFRFGHKQAGTTAVLAALGERYGFAAKAMPSLRIRGRVVSSSEIRQWLQAGDVAHAARMLGRFFSLEGMVVRGQGVGSRQTVPTLNLSATLEVLPALGVYVTRTFDLDEKREWPSISNIGYRPTFGGEDLTIESYLLEPLEGEPPARISVELRHRIRDERRFDNAEALKVQILQDVERAQAWHRRWDRWRGTAKRR